MYGTSFKLKYLALPPPLFASFGQVRFELILMLIYKSTCRSIAALGALKNVKRIKVSALGTAEVFCLLLKPYFNAHLPQPLLVLVHLYAMGFFELKCFILRTGKLIALPAEVYPFFEGALIKSTPLLA
jgi:hypothetical protein